MCFHGFSDFPVQRSVLLPGQSSAVYDFVLRFPVPQVSAEFFLFLVLHRKVHFPDAVMYCDYVPGPAYLKIPHSDSVPGPVSSLQFPALSAPKRLVRFLPVHHTADMHFPHLPPAVFSHGGLFPLTGLPVPAGSSQQIIFLFVLLYALKAVYR